MTLGARWKKITQQSELVKQHLSCGYPHDNKKKYKIGGLLFMYDDFDLSRLDFFRKICKKIVVITGEENEIYFGKNVQVYGYNTINKQLGFEVGIEWLRKHGCTWVTYLDDFERFEDRFKDEIFNLTTPTEKTMNVFFDTCRKIDNDIYTRVVNKKRLLPRCRLIKVENKWETIKFDKETISYCVDSLPKEMNRLSNLRLKIEKQLDNYNENQTPVFRFNENEFYLQNTFSEKKPTLAMVTMVKNEEKNIARCLNSIKSIVDEIILTDTGSTDRTVEIAESLGAKVIHYPWVNDYSEPRNIGLRRATTDWILILDGDEFLNERDLESIEIAIRNQFYDAYRMHKRSYVGRLSLRNAVARPENDIYEESRGYAGWIREGVDCLFKNDPRIYYSYNIHEITGRSLGEYHFNVMEIDAPIHHDGRHDMSGKEDKYLDMVRRRAEIYPNDGASYCQIASHEDWKGNSKVALKAFKKSYECTEDCLSLHGIALSLMKLGRLNEAKDKFIELLEREPWQNPIWGYLMECYYQFGNYRQMRETYEKSLSLDKNNIHVRMTYVKIQLRRNIIIDARDKILEVLKINPTNGEAKEILRQITGNT